MFEQITLAQATIDAVRCGMEVRYEWAPIEFSSSMVIAVQMVDPRTGFNGRDTTFIKRVVVIDLDQFVAAKHGEEFLRVRVVKAIGEMMRERNGLANIPREIRERWAL